MFQPTNHISYEEVDNKKVALMILKPNILGKQCSCVSLSKLKKAYIFDTFFIFRKNIYILMKIVIHVYISERNISTKSALSESL